MTKSIQRKAPSLTRLLIAAFIASLCALSLSTTPAHASQLDLAAQSAEELAAQSPTLINESSAAGLKSGHTYVVYSALKKTSSLEVSGASTADGANVQVWNFSRALNQQWIVTVDSKGRAEIRSLISGKCLDVAGAAAKSGANVQQYSRNGTLAQKWHISKNSNGTYRIASALNRKLSLSVSGSSASNGANVNITSNSNGKAQQWKLTDVTKMQANLAKLAKKHKGTVKAGTYVVFSGTGNNAVLDIDGASAADGANLQIYTNNGSAAQRFTISYDKKGYALIRTCSGKYLDVSGACAANGTNVAQYAKNDTLAQKWIISKNSGGTYRIQSALWPKVSLDVAGGSSSDGTNVQIYDANSSSAQKWTFKTPAAATSKIKSSSPAPSLNGIAKSSFNGIGMSGAKAAGIDVSVWNGNINWSKVAASGVKFAIIRCGYGDDFTSQDDTKFIENVKGARAAGLDIGVYLYSYAVRTTGTQSAQSEANHTLRLLKAAGLTPSNLKYGVYYDIEDECQQNANLTAICKKYCTKLRSAGYSVGVYSALSWWDNKLTSSAFNKWNRWVAQWPIKAGNQKCSYGKTYRIWQCMSDGRIPGIIGNVDMNLAY